MTDIDALIAFLRTCIDEDQRVAEDAKRNGPPLLQSAHFNPDRMLAEVDAKRRIIDEHAEPGDDNVICRVCREPWQGDFTVPLPCLTLRLLALPYAGHPDYREDFRP